MTEWFETHAHLSDSKFDADRDETIQRAYDAGIVRIIEIADGPEEWASAKTLAERYVGRMWWAAGIHPYYADQGSHENFDQLKKLSQHPQFVALGEVGLDYAKCPISPEVQKKTLTQALELSREIDKPLIIHCREAFPDLLTLFRPFFSKNPKRSPGVIHCFSGEIDEARDLIEMGFFIGVDGPLTYPNAKKLRETIGALPLDKLVIETDSPYLPPQTHRGLRNEPMYLQTIGKELAFLAKISPEKLSTILRQSSNTLFRLN